MATSFAFVFVFLAAEPRLSLKKDTAEEEKALSYHKCSAPCSTSFLIIFNLDHVDEVARLRLRSVHKT